MNDQFGGWRKTSYSGTAPNCVEVGWRKATHSANAANCVEVAADACAVGVRDTKQYQAGPVLEFSAGAWHAFITGIKA